MLLRVNTESFSSGKKENKPYSNYTERLKPHLVAIPEDEPKGKYHEIY